jgi:hypothetical protein
MDVKFIIDTMYGPIDIESFYQFRKKVTAPAPNWLKS